MSAPEVLLPVALLAIGAVALGWCAVLAWQTVRIMRRTAQTMARTEQRRQELARWRARTRNS